MELTGFPAGVLASDANARANIGTVLAAQRALGEIEARPVELEHKRALADNARALAEQHREQAERSRRAAADLDLMRRLGAEASAQERAVEEARVAGRDLTVADRPPGGFSASRSRADPLRRMIDYASAKGAPLDMLIPLEEKASKLAHEEATTINAQAEAQKRQLESTAKAADIRGTLAQSALKGPREYAMARALGLSMGVPFPEGLPMQYEAARPYLQQLVETSLDVKDKAELAIKERSARADEARAGAALQNAKTNSRKADAYVATSSARRDVLRKALGDGSSEAVDAKAATTEAKRTAAFRSQLVFAPMAPIKFETRHEGKMFTGIDRKIYRYDGLGPPSAKYPDGTPLLLPMSREAAAMRSPGVKAALGNDEPGDE